MLEQTRLAFLREALKDILRNNKETTLRFTKADGSERTMVATLDEQVLLEKLGDSYEHPEDSTLLAEYAKPSVSVYDLEADGWRSFKLRNLFEINSEHPTSVISRYIKEYFPPFVGETSEDSADA